MGIVIIFTAVLYALQLSWLITEINRPGCDRSFDTKRVALLCLIPGFPVVHGIVKNFNRLG